MENTYKCQVEKDREAKAASAIVALDMIKAVLESDGSITKKYSAIERLVKIANSKTAKP
jgi:hypothetical protein